MRKKKVYKINENQLKLIVGKQKQSPQLQTEVLDRTAEGFGKLLSWGFKQSINAFKFFNGIGVNVFSGDRFTPNGKFPVKKYNPLAPLSLYNAKLTDLPKNYQNLFKTISTGIPSTDNNDDADDEYNVDSLVNDEFRFDTVKNITYPVKFEFQNLKREAKENSDLMMTTWALIFNVTSKGIATSYSSMDWELVGFSSQGASITRFLSAMMNKENTTNDVLRTLSKYDEDFIGANRLSLIFSSVSESEKFNKVMKKQIEVHMKTIIEQLNAKMGVKNAIKTPEIVVKVNPTLIGDAKIQPQNKPTLSLEEIENDMSEILEQIQKYKNQKTYQEYIKKLIYIYNKLKLQREQIYTNNR